ncbi:MAG: 4'-phosphopantetheinyl transferase family protein [Candidatus Angelobacter sp.]
MVDGANVWVASAARGEIEPAEVHVWRVSLIRPEVEVRWHRQFLSPIEAERADRYYFDRHRNRFIVARSVLRQLLGTYLHLDPRVIDFAYGPQGKPDVVAPQNPYRLRFNLSHSGELALIAVSLSRELGIDVERIKPDIAGLEIATRFFSPEECAKLECVLPNMRVDAFFDCWTRKEAYIKARGEGLSIPLDSFEVAFAPGVEPALLQAKTSHDAPSRWRFHALHPDPGYKAALAVEGSDHELQLWEWEHNL